MACQHRNAIVFDYSPFKPTSGLVRNMTSEEAVTKFLNVDCDIRGDARDLEALLRSIEASVVVLSHAGREASIELAKQCSSLEETISAFANLFVALRPEAKSIWDGLEFRSLNVGVQAAAVPYAASFAISVEAVESIAALGLEIVFTVYAPLAD
jgi:hypothetical protein